MKLNIQLQKNQSLFFTSDLHDMHEKAIRYDSRPFKDVDEMHGVLVENWNHVVHKGDIVFILGDLTFKPEAANRILSELNGKKYLVIGNHDNFINKDSFDKSLLEGYMDVASFKYKGYHLVLSHYPIEIWDRKHYGSIHLHGHIHNDLFVQPPNRYNVCTTLHGYTPVTLEQLISKYGYFDPTATDGPDAQARTDPENSEAED